MNQETWIVTNDGLHNAFTDLILWRDLFWLIYVSSPSHFKNKASRLVLMNSKDAHSWQEVKIFDGSQVRESVRHMPDIRDPKLAVIQNKLFVFALLNEKFDPEPYQTILSSSADGITWEPFSAALSAGWLLGHPIVTNDGKTAFAAAHRIDQGTAALFTSEDGYSWFQKSTIFDGNGNAPGRADETAIQFTGKGEMLAVTRLESGSSLFGNKQACTLISSAVSPFDKWTNSSRSFITRLDGPVLFCLHDKMYAVGRRQVEVKHPLQGQGSAFGRKRTALFMVNLPILTQLNTQQGERRTKNSSPGLLHLFDLPSSGDTSYAGVVVKDGVLYISYYSNDPGQDDPWLIGMLRPTQIMISAVKIEELPN